MFGRILWSATVHAFVFSALSSYHAVQGRMEELRVHVGEACELALVDVGDDQLIGRGQHRLRTREKLVEVFCSFATLKEIFFRYFDHEKRQKNCFG